MLPTSRRAISGIFRRLSAFAAGPGPDGCEFVICFDDGAANEFNTLLVTDWFAHTPPAVLAKNFGAPAKTFANIPLNNLWIFQGKVPGDLSSVRKAMTGDADTPPTVHVLSRIVALPEPDEERHIAACR